MTSNSHSEADRVFTQHQICAGAFLAGPLTACIMLALNFRTMGQPEKFLPTLALGVGMIVVVCVATSHFSVDVPGFVYGAVYAAIFAGLTHLWQGEDLRERAAIGIPLVGFAKSLGIVCLGFTVSAAIVIAYTTLDPSW